MEVTVLHWNNIDKTYIWCQLKDADDTDDTIAICKSKPKDSISQ